MSPLSLPAPPGTAWTLIMAFPGVHCRMTGLWTLRQMFRSPGTTSCSTTDTPPSGLSFPISSLKVWGWLRGF